MSNSIKQKPRVQRNNINRSNEIHINSFVADIRAYLIVVENKNIEIRCRKLEEIVNNQTQSVKTTVFGHNYNRNQHKAFTYSINDDKMKGFLSYIYEWNGLKIGSANLPKTKKEYEKKAKNWLNGRRSTKYGNTLFVDMLNHCKKYAEDVSLVYFGNIKNKTEATNKRLYYQLLLYAFLLSICSIKFNLHKSMKKTYLISDHAIIGKTETKQLIRQFVNKYSPKLFPCHRDEAIDYFKKQYERTSNTLHSKLNEIKINPNISSIEAAESFITDIVKNKTVNSDGTISIEMNKFRKLLNIMDHFQTKHAESQNMINLLNDKIHELEYKKAAYIDAHSNVITKKCRTSMNATNSDAFSDYYNTNHSMHIDDLMEQTTQWPDFEMMDNLSVGFNNVDVCNYDFNIVDEQEYYSQFNSI